MDFLTIVSIFTSGYYAVPDYQRDYEWRASENATLIDDVLQIVRDGSHNHFFGAIVTIPYDKNAGKNASIKFEEYNINTSGGTVKHVVDGQQRLTSFSIMVIALQDSIDADESIAQPFKDQIHNVLRMVLYGTNFKGLKAAPRLILNKDTGHCYNKELLKISDENYNKKLKGPKRLMAAYELYKTELKNGFEQFKEEGLCNNAEEYYSKLVEAITNKVIFVEIKCDASSNAFQVFDSLNGKGLDLTAADRIKNIFMSWSPEGTGIQKWESFVSEVGEDYLANFFVSLFFYNKKKRIQKNNLPNVFKDMFSESASEDFDYFYKELKESGSLYGKLRRGKLIVSDEDNNENDNELNLIIKDFQSLNVDQVYVLLFAVAKHYDDIIDTDEYKELAITLQKLIVRMQVCEKSTNKLDTLFSSCIDSMENTASISVITKKLEDEIKNNVDDDLFKKSFVTFCPRDNKVSEYYLRHLENYLQTQNGVRNPFKKGKGLTVEHIIPVGLEDLTDWYGNVSIPDEVKDDFKQSVVENIGNKALLYGDDNSSANNNNYDYKRDVYLNGKRGQNEGTPIGTFCLIKDLLDNHPRKFIHKDVVKRAGRLAEKAVEIW